jgi:hypothetical protein
MLVTKPVRRGSSCREDYGKNLLKRTVPRVVLFYTGRDFPAPGAPHSNGNCVHIYIYIRSIVARTGIYRMRVVKN